MFLIFFLYLDVWICGHVIGKMEWMNEWMDAWINRRVCEWIDGWGMDRQADGWTDRHMTYR